VPTPDTIRERLSFVGDSEIYAVVLEALSNTPPPVVCHTLATHWICGIGWGSSGWNAEAPPLPTVLSEGLRIISLTGHCRDAAEIAGTVAHEVAHGWLLAPIDPIEEIVPVAMREARETYLTQMAVSVGRLDVLIDRTARHERWATACARAWGFTGLGADGEACVSAARQHVLKRAALHDWRLR
jgi:hypothetical protein